MIVDSDILIDFLKNDKKALGKIKELKSSGIDIATTSINSFELLNGVSVISASKSEAIANFLDSLQIYSFDYDISKKAAEIYRTLKSKGEMIELTDIMIASIAIENSETLLTKNANHFKRISNLSLETY